MAIHGLKRIALAVGLWASSVAAQAQPVPPKLPTRPAPVSGKVAVDPAAVALRPAAAIPAVATSTARQVPPPANPHEPLLKSEAELAASPSSGQAQVQAPTPVPSAVPGKPHEVRTEGKPVPEATKGNKKARKSAGHEHMGKTTGAGQPKHKPESKPVTKVGKAKASKGPAGEKLAQAAPASGRASSGHAKAVGKTKAHPTHQLVHDKAKNKTKALAKVNQAEHKKGHAKAASAPTVSTAHELKPTAAQVKRRAKLSAKQASAKHKATAHHQTGQETGGSKVASADAVATKRKAAIKPAAKPKKKVAHGPAAA